MATQKRILMICGDRNEEFEATVPFYALQAYGFTVHAVSPGKKAGEFVYPSIFQRIAYQYATEIEGHKFKLNATFDEVRVKATNYDGLVIPGGGAPEHLARNESVVDLVKEFEGKPIASICHGSLILAAADMLEGRTLTAFPSLKAVMEAAGAHWVPPQTSAYHYLDKKFKLASAASYEGNAKFISSFLEILSCKVTGADGKRILFLCGDYTEELELMVPFQSLQALGCHVDAVCPNKREGETCITTIQEYESGAQTYSGKPGYSFPITKTFENVDSLSYDALVVPGGQAPEYLSLNKDVLNLVKEVTDAGKPVGSMGHGQMILSFADVLKKKECTAHPWVKLNVEKAGGIWKEPNSAGEEWTKALDFCYTDGNLVTGAAWPGNSNFISRLMEVLKIKVSV